MYLGFPAAFVTSYVSGFPRSFRGGTPPVVNKSTTSPCADEPSKTAFEQAVTGVLGESARNESGEATVEEDRSTPPPSHSSVDGLATLLVCVEFFMLRVFVVLFVLCCLGCVVRIVFVLLFVLRYVLCCFCCVFVLCCLCCVVCLVCLSGVFLCCVVSIMCLFFVFLLLFLSVGIDQGAEGGGAAVRRQRRATFHRAGRGTPGGALRPPAQVSVCSPPSPPFHVLTAKN